MYKIELDKVKCRTCGTECLTSIRHCPTCDEDLGYPNVRFAEHEQKYLHEKYDYKVGSLSSEESAKLVKLETCIESNSKVVVAVPEIQAKVFLQDSRNLYSNYESQVQSGGRVPAPYHDDTIRMAIAGKLFGHSANMIKYGVLSLSNESLHNYGNVFFTLKNVSIEKRVSFLIDNSYHFAENHDGKLIEPLPVGYRAHWGNKEKLVIYKLFDTLKPNFHNDDCMQQLVCQGEDRGKDCCIEAHIFGNFNIDSVETIKFSPKIRRKEKRILQALAEKRNIKVA